MPLESKTLTRTAYISNPSILHGESLRRTGHEHFYAETRYVNVFSDISDVLSAWNLTRWHQFVLSFRVGL